MANEKLDFEVRGTRNGKSGRWKLRAGSIAQASDLAVAQGVMVQSVAAIRSAQPDLKPPRPSAEPGMARIASVETRPVDFYDRLWAATKRTVHYLAEQRRIRKAARGTRNSDTADAAAAIALANVSDDRRNQSKSSVHYEITIEFDVHVTGVTHQNRDGTNRQTILRRCSEGDAVVLKREPANRYDRNAIAVFTNEREQIGYVPAEQTSQIAPLMDAGVLFGGRISLLMGGTDEKPTLGAVVQVGRLVEAK